MTMTERALFRKMQDGDMNAFNTIFLRYSERMFYYALGFLKNAEASEDIVQEIFVWLWTNRSSITYKGSFHAYLNRAVKNACINLKNHKKVEERYRNQLTLTKGYDVFDDGEEPEDIFERLQALMDALPPKCREIFVLGCVEGMSYKNIAEKLNISVNTVNTQIKTA